jgi:N-acetylmuramoyl-L-alanine amidase
MISESILCLAVAIFKESRGEPVKAQYMVAEVVHNRTKHPNYPSDYCSVIKQKNQFSFYKNSNSLKPPRYEMEAWEKSVAVARSFSKNKTNYTKGAVYFNHTRLGVRYKTNIKPINCGNHIFY